MDDDEDDDDDVQLARVRRSKPEQSGRCCSSECVCALLFKTQDDQEQPSVNTTAELFAGEQCSTHTQEQCSTNTHTHTLTAA